MRSGDPCACGLGRMLVYKTITRGHRTRYLRCTNPGCPQTGKEILKSYYQSGNPETSAPNLSSENGQHGTNAKTTESTHVA